MKGIAKHDVCINLPQICGRHGLYRPVSTNGHESWRLHRSMGECQCATAGMTVTAMQLKLHVHQIVERNSFLERYTSRSLQPDSSPGCPFNQHRVTITEKAIALIYRVFVGATDVFNPSERGHQHQQGRAWQVKIGQQAIHHAKPITGRNENISLAMT